jgi:hypothetical protein
MTGCVRMPMIPTNNALDQTRKLRSVGCKGSESGMKGEPASTSTTTCRVCHSVYLRRAERVNFRGRGEKICEVCGELLERWEGRHLPTFKLVKRGTLKER